MHQYTFFAVLSTAFNKQSTVIFVISFPIYITKNIFVTILFSHRYLVTNSTNDNCTARQCSPLRRKFMECYLINPALSLLTKHLVIGQRQKAPNFSAFHWSPHVSLVSIGQHFVITRVVHLPKRTDTSLIAKSDQIRPNHQLLQLCTARTAWSMSDQAVRAVHSCSSWFISKTIDNFPSPSVALRLDLVGWLFWA